MAQLFYFQRRNECVIRLIETGIEAEDALTLRRIAMTLHRWHEYECNGNIQRDEDTGKCLWFNTNARYVDPRDPRAYSNMADRETGALKRLDKLMARYPTLSAYVQGDPRGAALYILRPGDVPKGKDIEAYYSRGIAVYK